MSIDTMASERRPVASEGERDEDVRRKIARSADRVAQLTSDVAPSQAAELRRNHPLVRASLLRIDIGRLELLARRQERSGNAARAARSRTLSLELQAHVACLSKEWNERLAGPRMVFISFNRATRDIADLVREFDKLRAEERAALAARAERAHRAERSRKRALRELAEREQAVRTARAEHIRARDRSQVLSGRDEMIRAQQPASRRGPPPNDPDPDDPIRACPDAEVSP